MHACTFLHLSLKTERLYVSRARASERVGSLYLNVLFFPWQCKDLEITKPWQTQSCRSSKFHVNAGPRRRASVDVGIVIILSNFLCLPRCRRVPRAMNTGPGGWAGIYTEMLNFLTGLCLPWFSGNCCSLNSEFCCSRYCFICYAKITARP